MTKGSEFHWQGRGKRASSPLRHISPRVIHSGRLDKKPGGEPITPIANHALDESMKASAPIYFDITDIIEHAMRNSVVTGVQRSAIRIIEGFIRNGCADQIYGFLKHPVSGQFTLCDLSFMKGAYDIGDFAARFGLPSGKVRRQTPQVQKSPSEAAFSQDEAPCSMGRFIEPPEENRGRRPG